MTDYKVNKDLSQAPIGVFDSGVGGLTVAREIMRQMPKEKIIYFGDTARLPYGNKSKDTVTRFSRQIARFLLSHEVKTIVVACNTASAYAVEELEAELDIPVIGVVKPGARMAVDITKNGKIVSKLTNPFQERVDIAKSLFGILPADITLEEAQKERLDQI